MKNGIYRYEDKSFGNRGEIILKVTETEKTITFELLKNDMRFSPAQIDEMFVKSNKAKINKLKCPHAMDFYNDYFVIYPYRAGIPFLFEYVEGGMMELEKFVKERDEMLLKRDVNELRKFVNDREGIYGRFFVASINTESDGMLGVTLHKMIANATSLPREFVAESKEWLKSRGYSWEF